MHADSDQDRGNGLGSLKPEGYVTPPFPSLYSPTLYTTKRQSGFFLYEAESASHFSVVGLERANQRSNMALYTLLDHDPLRFPVLPLLCLRSLDHHPLTHQTIFRLLAGRIRQE